ncbi:CRISPR-associated protein [filamentous cyanobacterium LEGE 11480]|uniref:CRISPR-associated protein n=1 Tax=Romeriopsis navalis LEGE 11480 TaxID=2777977 RepID=A0A928VV34_9CYAN|nr:type III-B CRISPR module-associated Cmr3 family protein [Romeriopsis navalis]MBE9033130.1 CRISPR-associated protein [Romeriopsis navalis LEGE 11480]
MFQFLIKIRPLGLMYGSAGAFLSPENLVGRSGTKFPPDPATLSGLYFSTNKTQAFIDHQTLRNELHIAGPFWADIDDPEYFYVPVPKHKLVTQKDCKTWFLKQGKWHCDDSKDTDAPTYDWQTINAWDGEPESMKSNSEVAENPPWKFIPVLHPKTKPDERVVDEDGLFLENAVQFSDEHCLVYLATHAIPDGWYRFGGEGHIVEITHEAIVANSPILDLLNQPIERAFALITPAVWGSTRFSYRYPQHADFPKPVQMLIERPKPFRYRVGGRLGRGRYAVPAGSVYVFDQPLNRTWWEFESQWFPQEGMSLKHLGCGLCLPIAIDGIETLNELKTDELEGVA